MSRIVVIGGTGQIGSRVVNRLTASGHDAIAASPSTGVDAASGSGLNAVMQGADVVIDASKPRVPRLGVPHPYYTASTSNLISAERRAGVRHHIFLAAVGTGRPGQSVPVYRAKAEAEKRLIASGIPFTLLHATQFMEFAQAIADQGTRIGRARLPHALVQPIAADDVAAEVARAADEVPIDGIVEIAGPERMWLIDFIRRVLTATNDPRPIEEHNGAMYFGGRISETSLVPGPRAFISPTTLDAWLANHSTRTHLTGTVRALMRRSTRSGRHAAISGSRGAPKTLAA